MITSLLDKTLADLSKKIDKLISRLEVDLSGVNCREILIHNKRLDVLKKNIDALREQESKVREKYEKYEKMLTSSKHILSKVIKLGVISIVVLSVFIALIYLEVVLGVQTISLLIPVSISREDLPYISTSIATLIGVFSITTSMLYGIHRRRVSVLSREFIQLKKKYADLVSRLKILEREYEISYKYRAMIRALNLCKCYVELSEFREKIWLLNKILSEIKNCSSRECLVQYLDELVILMNKIRETKTICNTMFTEEYRVSIEATCNDSKERVLSNNCYLKITIGLKEYLLAIDSYLTNIVSSMYSSSRYS